jgi:hypothetical protein
MEILRDDWHILGDPHSDPVSASRHNGRCAPAKGDGEHAPDEGSGVSEGIAAFVIRPCRDHFEYPASLCCALPHHAAGVRSSRAGRADDFKLRIVEPLVLE